MTLLRDFFKIDSSQTGCYKTIETVGKLESLIIAECEYIIHDYPE